MRLRLEVASRRTRRAKQARRQNVGSTTSEGATPLVTPAEAVVSPPTACINGAQEKAAFEAFYDKYEALTCLICLAAQDGITGAQEARYQAARIWLMEAYPAGIQQGVSPYLEAAAAADPFSCFWTPPTLADLLHNDDGSLITRMEQTLNALAAWEKALSARA